MYRAASVHQETSLSSISSMSNDEEQLSTSSPPTSTQSSPYNGHMIPVSSPQGLESPDLLQTGFYNSDSSKDHATNLRKSMVVSESMESVKLKDPQEKVTTTGQIALTNSPSLSALAAILEKKSTKYQPSPLHSNASLDTITAKEESPSAAQLRPIEEVSRISIPEEPSPNLIQIDDEDATFNTAVNTSTVTAKNTQEENIDIFETPQVPRLEEFPKQDILISKVVEYPKEMSHSTSFASVIQKSPIHPIAPEIIHTPDLCKHQSRESIDASIKSSPKILQSTPRLSQGTNDSSSGISAGPNEGPKILPRTRAQFNSPRYSQRSSSLPVLTDCKDQQQKKKWGFMSLFKSNKRSVSQGVEQIKPQPREQEVKKQKAKVDKKHAQTLSNSISHSDLQATRPKVARRSTSTNSLFSAFKRKSKLIPVHPESEKIDSPIKSSSSSRQSLEDFGEFNEDFNNLKVQDPVPTELDDINRRASQVSNGEVLFPKSLNPREVESIVSLERNRSVRSARSRHSISSTRQHRMSLTEAIQSNAKGEGWSIEFGKETSIPDLTKSPQSSVLKKPSISSVKKYLSDEEQDDEQLFNVEEFSQTLEFDNIVDSYELTQDEEAEDISKLAEFADFINFGDDLDLNFDLPTSDKGTPYDSPDPSKLTAPLSNSPFNSQSLNQSPAMSFEDKFNSGLELPSPLSSPFLPQTNYVPNAQGSLARPISMSFRGLKAPALGNPHNYTNSDDGSSFRSFHSERRSFNPLRKVTFSSKITLYDAFHEDDYDRHPDIATCNQLTPAIAQMIKDELNALKAEMEIHESSRCYTHFY